ncbi:MAG TPA: hypothetical protein VFO89_15770 [Thermoanaerobaculia bacterium]|nr:hypothetical protein [Thermoanaerobaculia bacterium]
MRALSLRNPAMLFCSAALAILTVCAAARSTAAFAALDRLPPLR